MAGTTEPDSKESQRNEECSFVWDDNSQLYYHPSSGFYHDPTAGWYYSSKDGLYYKFEDGNYMLLGSESSDQCTLSARVVQWLIVLLHHWNGWKIHLLTFTCRDIPTKQLMLYIDVSMPMETDHGDCLGAGNYDNEPEEGECIPDEDPGVNDSSGVVSEEGTSWEEENWHAQYGQVIHSGEETVPDFQTIDLWDWAMVRGTRKDGKNPVARLVGRLMRQSARLHPSMPLGGGILKTAPISEVHLDLVRVTSGQVYKLRSPSARYLASLSTHDSSNPTKDWGFPQLQFDNQMQIPPASNGNCEAKLVKGVRVHKDLPSLLDQVGASKNGSYAAWNLGLKLKLCPLLVLGLILVSKGKRTCSIEHNTRG